MVPLPFQVKKRSDKKPLEAEPSSPLVRSPRRSSSPGVAAAGDVANGASSTPTSTPETTPVVSAAGWGRSSRSTLELRRALAAAEARVATLAVAKAKLLATQLAMDHREAGKAGGLKIAPGLPP